jgi:hypothetical protein
MKGLTHALVTAYAAACVLLLLLLLHCHAGASCFSSPPADEFAMFVLAGAQLTGSANKHSGS